MNFNVETLPGWCTQEKAELLYNSVGRINSQISIELGVFGGRSLIPMALAHKQKGSGFAIGFDAYKGKVCAEGTNAEANNAWWMRQNMMEIYHNCIEAIEAHELGDFCSVVRMRSQDAGLLIKDNCVDILHQDSNHNWETILAEVILWIPKVKVGGLWIADDVLWTEAKDAYDKLPEYGLELINDFVDWRVYKKVK